MKKTITDRHSLRPIGKKSEKVLLLLACSFGVIFTFLGLAVPILAERAVWLNDVKNIKSTLKVPTAEINGNADFKVIEPFIFKYPLLRLLSRIKLGPVRHKAHISLAQELPLVLQLINTRKYQQAEELLVRLFSAGAFSDDSELIVLLQQFLLKCTDLHTEVEKVNGRIKGEIDSISNLEEEWWQLNKDLRLYLKIPLSITKTNCQIIDCALYESGPLSGLPVQEEFALKVENYKELAKYLVQKLTPAEVKALTDDKIIMPLKEMQSNATGLIVAYKRARLNERKEKKQLRTLQRRLEKNEYLLKKKIIELIQANSLPPI
jgi:hypothetical protein